MLTYFIIKHFITNKCLEGDHFIYGIGDMVKDLSDSMRGNPLTPLYELLFAINSKGCNKGSKRKKENPLLPHGLLFLISSKWYFMCTIPQTGW